MSSGYLGNPAVETAGFKMIDVSQASILSTKFRTARISFDKKTTFAPSISSDFF